MSNQTFLDSVWTCMRAQTLKSVPPPSGAEELAVLDAALRYGIGPYDCAAQILANRQDREEGNRT